METKECLDGNKTRKRFFIKIENERSADFTESVEQNMSRCSLKVPKTNSKEKLDSSSNYSSSVDPSVISFQITKFLSTNPDSILPNKAEVLDPRNSPRNFNDSLSKTLPERKNPEKKSKSQMCSPVCIIF